MPEGSPSLPLSTSQITPITSTSLNNSAYSLSSISSTTAPDASSTRSQPLESMPSPRSPEPVYLHPRHSERSSRPNNTLSSNSISVEKPPSPEPPPSVTESGNTLQDQELTQTPSLSMEFDKRGDVGSSLSLKEVSQASSPIAGVEKQDDDLASEMSSEDEDRPIIPSGFIEALVILNHDSLASLAASNDSELKLVRERYIKSWVDPYATSFSFKKDKGGTSEETTFICSASDAFENVWLPFVTIETGQPIIHDPTSVRIKGKRVKAWVVTTLFDLWATSHLDPEINPLAGRGFIKDKIILYGKSQPRKLKVHSRTMIIQRDLIPEYTKVFRRGFTNSTSEMDGDPVAYFNTFTRFMKIANRIRVLRPYVQFLIALSAVIASIQNLSVTDKSWSTVLASVGIVSALLGVIIWGVDRLVAYMDYRLRKTHVEMVGGTEHLKPPSSPTEPLNTQQSSKKIRRFLFRRFLSSTNQLRRTIRETRLRRRDNEELSEETISEKASV